MRVKFSSLIIIANIEIDPNIVYNPKNQLLQVILLSLSKMHVLARSYKTVVLARQSKSILQDLSCTCKIHHVQDRARGSCKYLQDPYLARQSKSIYQVLARLTRTYVVLFLSVLNKTSIFFLLKSFYRSFLVPLLKNLFDVL